jgi:hypothetical protein
LKKNEKKKKYELCCVQSLVHSTTLILALTPQVKTFDDARNVFKLAMARHAKAKTFFVLDG